MINLVAFGSLIAIPLIMIYFMERDYRRREKEWKEYVESFLERKKEEEKK